MKTWIDFKQVEAVQEMERGKVKIYLKSGNIIIVERSYAEVIEVLFKTLKEGA